MIIILVLIALGIFITYNAVFIGLYGVPTSLSDTFYVYQNKKKGLGYIFSLMMFSMCFFLMPAWLSISDSFTTWEHNLTFLAFFAAGSIAFVGAAPAFRNIGIENKVHMIAAKSCAVFAIAWCAIVCWRIMYIIPISIAIIWLIAYLCDKNFKRNSDYWWEMCAFTATFSTVIVQQLINILNG